MKNRSVYIQDDSSKLPLHPLVKLGLKVLKVVVIFVLIIGFAVAGLAGGAVYAFLSDLEPLKAEELTIESGLTSFIYDNEMNVIAKLTGSDNLNREIVNYEQIPEDLRNALIAIEDERFYTHNGVDTKRTLSAIVTYITGFGSHHGGSTITQQLIKIVTGNDAQSPQRKVQEWWLALTLEDDMEKWQILTEYLNRIYTGNGCYGVQSAAKTYFGKNVWDLSLAECALLAGLTNEPGTYNPFTKKGREAAEGRKDLILTAMLNQGWIKKPEFISAMAEKLVYADPNANKTGATVHTYFVDRVITEVAEALMEEYNIDRETAELRLYNNGYKIYTTQDPDIQAAMDKQFLNEDNFFKDNRVAKQYNETPQAAMVIIDPKTSHVLALYGGAGEKSGSRIFNRATQLDRHPGSSIKPIAVYGPAIDMGLITPATVVDDIPVRMYSIYDGEDLLDKLYPQNFEAGQYFGLTAIRTALQKSRNVPAAIIFRDILTPDNSVEYLKKVGLDRSDEKYISLALGGPADGMSPLEMAAAYVPFANKGVYKEPVTFTKVTDSKGKVLIENEQIYTIVYSESAAYLMIDLMKGVTRPGGTAANHIGPALQGADGEIPIAGKTGTAQDDRDKWFVGYTPYYVAATWYGYDNLTKPIAIQSGEEAAKSQKIWKAVMSEIHAELPAKDFEMPPVGLEKRTICIYSGKIATELCAHDPRGSAVREEYFVKGTEPAYDNFCDVHVKVKVCTASKDKWNRYLLAGDNCPSHTVIEKILIDRPEPYYPQMAGDPYPLDWAYDMPVGEYCTAHGQNVREPLE